MTVPLSTGEYELLLAMVERPQRVLSRDQLLDLDAGPVGRRRSTAASTRRSAGCARSWSTIRLEPRMIKTIWGGGYMFARAVTKA